MIALQRGSHYATGEKGQLHVAINGNLKTATWKTVPLLKIVVS